MLDSVDAREAGARRSQENAALQPYVLKFKWLAIYACSWRGDPVDNSSRFGHRHHQAANVLPILHRRQPARQLPFELTLRNQIPLRIEVMTGIFAYVTMEALDWQVHS